MPFMKKNKIKASRNHLANYINALNERISQRAKTINEDRLRDKFVNGQEVLNYDWSYQYSLVPRRSFITNSRLGFRGVKGIPKEFAETGNPWQCSNKPVWVTKEEFTILMSTHMNNNVIEPSKKRAAAYRIMGKENSTNVS